MFFLGGGGAHPGLMHSWMSASQPFTCWGSAASSTYSNPLSIFFFGRGDTKTKKGGQRLCLPPPRNTPVPS